MLHATNAMLHTTNAMLPATNAILQATNAICTQVKTNKVKTNITPLPHWFIVSMIRFVQFPVIYGFVSGIMKIHKFHEIMKFSWNSLKMRKFS